MWRKWRDEMANGEKRRMGGRRLERNGAKMLLLVRVVLDLLLHTFS